MQKFLRISEQMAVLILLLSMLSGTSNSIVCAAQAKSMTPETTQDKTSLPTTNQDKRQKTPSPCKPIPGASAAPPAGSPDTERAPGILPPLRQIVTSPFGLRRVPGWLSRHGMTIREHTGLDIRAGIGWPVTAFKGGEVLHAGDRGLLGIAVDIRQDNGMTAYYGHLGKTLVTRGQRVQAGDPVGIVGCTGRTTGAHLHFGLRDAAGKLVDPERYLERTEQILCPTPEQIPATLEAQACGPVLRGSDGRPRRMGAGLQKLDVYTPPPIPAWHKER